MPHRDPQTGQFVGGNHAGAVADADAVLRMNEVVKVGDDTVSDTDYAPPTTVDGFDVLEIQKDYRILMIETFLDAFPHNSDVATNSPQARMNEQAVHWQLATTGTYAQRNPPSEGGEMPVGVLYEHHSIASADIVWDDDTNQNAGVRPGTRTQYAEVVPAEKIVNADITPDAGTAINLHLDVTGQDANAETTEHRAEFRFYVAERNE